MSQAAPSPLLEVENLSVSFATPGGQAHVVRGLTYSLEAGRTLAVVGESGSGKSVHALAVAGLLDRDKASIESGSVRLGGQDLLQLSQAQLRPIQGRDIGFIFQDPLRSLNPLMTIGQQLAEPMRQHLKLDRASLGQACLALMDRVGLDQPERRLKSYPHQLSGGQRQRVMIAMAIACKPRLLIADEATTALDVTLQAQIVDLISELTQDLGLATLWISHDLGVVARIADEVQVMYAGQILERGPIEAVFADPRNAYTQGLLNALPQAAKGGRLSAIPGQPPSPLDLPPGDPFAPRNPYATARCHVERPPLRPVIGSAPGHQVAAFYDLKSALRPQEAQA